MATKRKIGSRQGSGSDRTAQASSASGPTAIAKHIGVHIDRIALRKLTYSELAVSEKPLPSAGEKTALSLNFEGRINVFPQGVEVYIEVTARPDPKFKPIEIIAGISGFFRRSDGLADTQLLAFAQGPGLRIVFPYLREVISETTARGMFGPIWLDPLNVSILSDKRFGDWQREETTEEPE